MDLVNSLSGSKKSRENQGSEGSNDSFFSSLKDSRLYKNLTNRNATGMINLAITISYLF